MLKILVQEFFLSPTCPQEFFSPLHEYYLKPQPLTGIFFGKNHPPPPPIPAPFPVISNGPSQFSPVLDATNHYTMQLLHPSRGLGNNKIRKHGQYQLGNRVEKASSDSQGKLTGEKGRATFFLPA